MATDEAGPSCTSAGSSSHGCKATTHDYDSSVTERLKVAALRDLLARDRAQLEQDRKMKEEAEKMDEALTIQLYEQDMRRCDQMGAIEPSGCYGGDKMEPTAPACCSLNQTPDIHPVTQCQPVSSAHVSLSSGGAAVLPDEIPVIIATPAACSPFPVFPGYTQPHPLTPDISPGDSIFVSESLALSSAHIHSTTAREACSIREGRCDISSFQQHIQAEAEARRRQEEEDERLAKRLQEESLQGISDAQITEAGMDDEYVQMLLAREQAEREKAEKERAVRAEKDAQLAAEAWAAEQKRAQEEAQRNLQGLEAARLAQKEEEERARQQQAAREAQAVENERIAQLLDSVSRATQQDIADLDRSAIIADEHAGPTFECPLQLMDCNKAEEGTVIGQWSKRCCNHWVSTDALVQYVCQEAEEQRFRMRCPVCKAARCERCELHAVNMRDGGCCIIPPRQIRSLLNEDQMSRLLFLQEQWYRTANKDKIVQCPHPDCQFFYALEAEDLGGQDDNNDDGADDNGDAGAKPRWQEGRDMWCDTCEVRYCLHCGDAMGTLVRWHDGKTCKQFLQEAENAEAAEERKRLEKVANEGHERNRGKTWQRCPRCGYEAWKADGQCNRVVCKEHCGANFCFLCGDDITKARYKHYEVAGHPCHLRVWHQPLAGTAPMPGAPSSAPCRCAGCRKA